MNTVSYLPPSLDFNSFVNGSAERKPLVDESSTIDPQKLSTASVMAQGSETQISDITSAGHPLIKLEMDEDYGFSKFAAERDAARNEDEMDEDTKLLMSEEGRKLSSKERRQLRNKVSARNFRERRKEYITHLESLVSKHQNDANVYKGQVDALKVEKDELASELAKLKITISAAIESNKLSQQNSTSSSSALSLTRSYSRCDTPSKEASLIPNLTKDINPYASGNNFNVDWPLSSMASPSNGSFDFSLHNYTSVFSVMSDLPAPAFSEKELLGKNQQTEFDQEPSECLTAFDQVLTSILGNNWNVLSSTKSS